MASEPGRGRITRELLFAAFAGPSTETEDPLLLERITTAVETEDLRAGDVLFRAGDPSEHVHFMSEGRMRLTSPGVADWIYEGRWVVGTTDVLAGRPHARTATMETDARLFRLSAARWFEVMLDRPEVILNAVAVFARDVIAYHVRLAPTGRFAQAAALADADTSSLAGCVRLLASATPFRAMPVQVLTELARAAETRELDAGESLFEPGVPPGRVFVVAHGRIEASRADPAVSATFSAGSIVGGAICLGDFDAAWGARALERSRVLSFATEDLLDHLEHHQDGMRAMMAAFALERDRLVDELAAEAGEIVLR